MNRLRRLVILTVLLVGVAVILTVTGWYAMQNALPPGVVTANVRVTAVLAQPTPIAPYGPVDPAIIPALQGTPGSKPFVVLPGVQPIGVYLPGVPTRAPSPTTTVTPSPTASTTPLPPTPITPLPTGTPTESATPSVTPSVTVTRLPSLTPTRTLMPGMPTPTPFPTDEHIEDFGVIRPGDLRMTPNPAVIGSDCAPHGLPVTGVLTQRYHRWHSGIDLGVSTGTPVIATQSGQVIFAGWSYIGYGWLVIIQNGHYITYYAHNYAFNVFRYQYVRAGEVIAYSGSTGNSSGPHVHYETRIDDVPVDPLSFDLRGLRTC